MEGSKNPAGTVISALAEHSIPVEKEEIDSYFDVDAKDAGDNATWVMEHLSNDTLLSKDELTLYSKLEGSGALKDVLENPDIDATRPFLDHDIRTAIESLRASTTAIQKQTGILNSQWEKLNSQIHHEDERRRVRGRDMAQLRKKHEQRTQNITAASSDLSHETESGMKSETEKATSEGRRILSLMSARLRDDDKTLVALESLAPRVDIAGGDDASTVRYTTELSATIAGYIAEEIHYRLDRLFLQCLLENNGSDPRDSSTGADDEEELMFALEGELDSLYPEIGVLAEMSTKQQFSDPISRELQDHHDQVRVTSHRKLEYIVNKISDMTSSAEILTERLKDRRSLRETLEALTVIYQSELTDQSLGKPTRRETLRRQSGQATMQRGTRRKSTVPLSESLAFASLLRRLGIHHESAFLPEKETGGSHMLCEKEAHMLESLRNLDVAADSSLTTQLIPMDSASRILSSSLDADSPFNRSLSNVNQERKLTALESQLGMIQKGIEGLNLDILYQRDKAQDRFIERWV